ncbi:hypothetical protein CO657_19855 [Rhizobium acidisoli]|uniref:Pentapeptide repeat-containing protein n=1 Tax=Rhizobium acidisoli TaxID=1538158 RepID=A0AAE5TYE1_9HYPH|nr:hypothetical protein [Rhizobium acidisoli]KPH09102.1 hypothetical protein AOG23_07425 [Rhizobium acidisoli]QAS80187.1 hypothetical protein CO657_19855 [Rhizobium acidisoli]
MENRPVEEWPQISEKHWYVLAICLVVIGLSLGVIAAAWVFNSGDLATMKTRTEIVMPFGGLLLALVTFCTVAWRGMVTSRQADQQRRQNDANDDANYAKLLQEGAKLIGENSKTSHSLAGISSLEILLNDDKRRYAIQAMDLIADFYIAEGEMHQSRAVVAARRALVNGTQLGITSTIHAHFKTDDSELKWPGVAGFRQQNYTGGVLTREAFSVISKDAFFVEKARIVLSKIDADHATFSRCTFDRCQILHLDDLDFMLWENNFQACELSGCVFGDDPADLAVKLHLTANGCWYDVANPPRYKDFSEWDKLLLMKRRDEKGLLRPVS